jgi:hypothetical protein
VLPGRPKGYLLLLVGPLLWLVSVVIVAVVLRRSDAIELGLLIAITSFGVTFAVLGWTQWRRRREQEGADRA